MARRRPLRVTIESIGGHCPRQAHGRIGELAFYVRERHGETSIRLGPPDPDSPTGVEGEWWTYDSELDAAQVRKMVRRAYALYRSERRRRRR